MCHRSHDSRCPPHLGRRQPNSHAKPAGRYRLGDYRSSVSVRDRGDDSQSEARAAGASAARAVAAIEALEEPRELRLIDHVTSVGHGEQHGVTGPTDVYPCRATLDGIADGVADQIVGQALQKSLVAEDDRGPGIDEGGAALQVALAAYESSRTGKRVKVSGVRG